VKRRERLPADRSSIGVPDFIEQRPPDATSTRIDMQEEVAEVPSAVHFHGCGISDDDVGGLSNGDVPVSKQVLVVADVEFGAISWRS